MIQPVDIIGNRTSISSGLRLVTIAGTVATVVACCLDLTWKIATVDAPWVGDVFRGFYVGYSEVALGLVAVLVFLGRRSDSFRKGTDLQGGRAIVVFGGILSAVLAISALSAIAPILSLGRAIEVAVGVGFVYAMASRPELKYYLAVGCLVVILLQLPLILLQEITQSTYPVHTLTPGLGAEVLANSPTSPVVIEPNGIRWERGQGSFPHPNVLGGFAAIAAVILLRPSNAHRRTAWWIFAVLLLAWLEIALSFSRAAALAAILATAVWFSTAYRQRVRSLSAPRVGGLLILALLAVVGLLSREIVMGVAPTANDPAVTQRFALARIAIRMVEAHPILGVGAGNFSLAELPPPTNAAFVDPVHVVPLLVAAEAGIPAGLAWLGLVLAPVIVAARMRSGPSETFRYRLAIASVLLTLGAFDHYLWSLPPGRTMFWIALGAGAAE